MGSAAKARTALCKDMLYDAPVQVQQTIMTVDLFTPELVDKALVVKALSCAPQ